MLALGGLFGALGVVSGALGSHVLKASLSAADFANFTTAVSYLLLHSAVLLLCGVLLGANKGNVWFKLAGGLLVVGILLFCGGLITRIVTGIPAFGRVVPIGGSALILAWLAIALGGIANIGKSR
jgi:uncharacterized membrane protein YgdD (TMEM256/DUF423 family)